MITEIPHLPPNVVGFKATGKVTRADFDGVLIPAVDAEAKKQGTLNYLLVLDTDISNMSAGAWVADITMGLKHFSQWRKMAIVSNHDGVNKVTDLSDPVLPGMVKSFTIAQTREAILWLAS